MFCPNLFDPYRKIVQRSTIISPGWGANRKVDEIASVLRQLLSDINNGLISSVVDRTVAETFDDFLDHAEEYLKDGRKDQAGVIAGVVFEDTIRRICRKKGVGEAGRKMNGLLDELTKAQVLTSLKTKRAKSAAHVRTKATHAQWEEFDASDVEAAIRFTRELRKAPPKRGSGILNREAFI